MKIYIVVYCESDEYTYSSESIEEVFLYEADANAFAEKLQTKNGERNYHHSRFEVQPFIIHEKITEELLNSIKDRV